MAKGKRLGKGALGRDQAALSAVADHLRRCAAIESSCSSQTPNSGRCAAEYLRELERYAGRGGHFSWWDERSIYEIRYGSLEGWSLWIAKRGLSPKTRWNVMGALRSFAGWIHRWEEIRNLPQLPRPKFDEHEPTILSPEAQDQVLEAIPELCQGISD